MDKIKLYLSPLAVIAVVAAALRLINIGYSDYQGDEIKALFRPAEGQNVWEFLLTQRKGPLQFLATYLIKFINPDYLSEAVTRLPFALAGVLAVIIFYKLVETHFNKKIAFFTAFFVATNGFFVALSRIAQYQSFVILFAVLTLYLFTLAATTNKWRYLGLYLGFISWGFSILSHYDGVYIAPFAAYLLYLWLKHPESKFKVLKPFASIKNLLSTKHTEQNAKKWHIYTSAAIFVAILLAFYIPFILHLDIKTLDYWQNRISGGHGKISSSYYLFQVYNPIYTVHVYTILGFLGAFYIASYELVRKVSKIRNLKVMEIKEFRALSTLDFNGYFTPATFVFLWFAVPFVFLEIMINIPGTHIFNYLIPATVIMAFGIEFIEKLTKMLLAKVWAQFKLPYGKVAGRAIVSAGIAVIFIFIFLQSYFVYVDHKVEYPWTSEKFLVWEFHRPAAIFHLSMFGYPYYRDWEGISKFVAGHVPEYPLTGGEKYYSTNERRSITRYYLPYQRGTDETSYFVYIVNPQSFTEKILNKKAGGWAETHEPIKTFVVDGKEAAKIYLLPDTTTL